MALPLIPIWAAVAAVASTNMATSVVTYFRGRKNGRRQIIRAQTALEGYPGLLTADVDTLIQQTLGQAAKLAEQEQTSAEIQNLQKEVVGLLNAQKERIQEEGKRGAVPQLTVKAASEKAAKAEAETKAKAEAKAEAKKTKKAKAA